MRHDKEKYMTWIAAKTLGKFLSDLNTESSNSGHFIGQKTDPEVLGSVVNRAIELRERLAIE